MKYFEIHDPYYVLLQAKDKEEAKEKYVKYVAGNEEDVSQLEIKEVDRDYALVKFSRAPGEDGVLLPISKTINEFNCQLNKVLAIDGSLI